MLNKKLLSRAVTEEDFSSLDFEAFNNHSQEIISKIREDIIRQGLFAKVYEIFPWDENFDSVAEVSKNIHQKVLVQLFVLEYYDPDTYIEVPDIIH